MSLLTTARLSKRFGGIVAVNEVDISVGAGEICGLIGPNGSGKTTLVNVITGIYRPTAGEVAFEGKPIHGRPAHEICAMGIGRTFQNIRLLLRLSIFDNIRLGAHVHRRSNLWDVLLQTGKIRQETKEFADRIEAMLDFTGLRQYRDELARNLPYGRQKVVEIARALMARPKLLLLDEPAAGLNSSEKGTLIALLRKIRDSGVSILLIEHEMALVEALSDRVFVLNYGKKISQGSFAEIQQDAAVIEAYLGRGGAHA
ncbi:MAG: ABC transporter ATP-binding protein [Candidatus Korobacteraceae bacterium]|jgi:branched-chain amino acid transport system ATP-binding protein